MWIFKVELVKHDMVELNKFVSIVKTSELTSPLNFA
jgi:hypothetical protein